MQHRRTVQNLAEFRQPPEFRGRSAVVVQLWYIVRDTLFLCSPQALYGWRRWLLRLFGARVGRNALIRSSVRVTYPWKVSIGDHAWVGDFVELYSLGPITIGDNAVVSQFSHLCTGSHDYASETFDIFAKPIVIEDEAWIAADVFIGPGVRVGFGALVAARSTLLQDAPAMTIMAGHPARPIRPRLEVDASDPQHSS